MIKKIVTKLRIKKWKNNGLKIGKNFQLERNSFIDSSFPWLIEIGDNVTIAPDVLVLSHDGSTKNLTGYTKIGKVKIGDNVFIGSKSIILPNTKIGKNSVIAAGSIVVGDVPDNVVVGGQPAKVIMDANEFKIKHENKMKNGITYDISYTRRGKVTDVKKAKMIKDLENNKNGYIV